MKLYLVVLTFITASWTQAQTNEQPVNPTLVLSEEQVEVLAKKAIETTTSDLNTLLSGQDPNAAITVYRPYTRAELNSLSQLGKSRISSNFLIEKCIYTKENLVSMMNDELTIEDDSVENHRTSLENIRTEYNRSLWKLISKACMNAQETFRDRLHHLTTHGGTSVELSDDAINGLTQLIFFPTINGKPSFKKKMNNAITTLISSGFLIGAGASLIGIPFAGMILTFSTLANAATTIVRTNVVHGSTLNGITPGISLDPYSAIDLDLN